jgi:transcription termination/antitermination protein NusA
MHSQPGEIEEVRRLFREHVPEVASGLVQIKGIARAPGKRVIVAVHSADASVDPIGSCVGERGIRVKAIVQELGGEKLDIVRWSDSLETLLINSLSPAKIDEIYPNEAARRAIIFTNIGDKALLMQDDGLRLKLVSRLVGWDLQVETG